MTRSRFGIKSKSGIEKTARRRVRRKAPGTLRGLAPEMARALAGWYARHARDLPWRRDRDPYRVLVSEIMLQQTRVETVAPYFERFIAAFPAVRALAAADVREVLALWSGLGYYRRARSLHAAARAMVRDHGGRIPDDEAALLRLPGIGPYTASAILTIAHGRAALALDGNLKRVLARLIAFGGDVRKRVGERALVEAGRALVEAGDPPSINQALMDIGASICTPRAPKCPVCPLAAPCEARRLGIAEAIPPAERRPMPVTVRLAAAVLRDRGRVLLRRRGGGLMAGMWEFPMVEVDGDRDGAASLGREVRRLRGVLAGDLRSVASLRHTITRHRIRIEVYEGEARRAARSRKEAAPGHGKPPGAARELAETRPSREKSPSDLAGTHSRGPWRWMPAARLGELPLTGIARKIVRLFGGIGPRLDGSPRRRRAGLGVKGGGA